MSRNYQHQSVLTEELIKNLAPQANQNFVDATLGGGGHTESLLQATGPKGQILAFELDRRALAATRKRLSGWQSRLRIVNDNYVNLKAAVKQQKFSPINGIIFDLGLSADQLLNVDRGFSFNDEGPLDMRFDPVHQTLTASDIILGWPEIKLVKIFREYGEEPQALRLARGIVKFRSSLKQIQKSFLGTSLFVSAILRILNIKEQDLKRYRRHPATQIFQALRIAVNQELDNLAKVLPDALEVLKPRGRLAVISFHSLEDRIVKNFFKREATDCLCPPNLPVCVCGHRAGLRIITPRPVRPSTAEITANPRSRSALLRVAEKI